MRIDRSRAGWLLFALSLVLLARAESLDFGPAQWLNMDEGYASAIGLRLLHHGGLPYVDAISVRGPIMYWAYELAVWAGGPFQVTAVRVAGCVSAALVVTGVWAAARALGASVGAGVAALLVVVHMTGLWHPFDGLAWNAELIALPFALFAVVAVSRASSAEGRAAYVWIGAAGALSAAAALAKQNFAVHGAVAFAWVVLEATERSRRSLRAAAFAVGALVVAASAVAPFVARGALAAFWYFCFRYGREVYLAPVGIRDVGRVFVTYFLAEGHLLFLVVAARICSAAPQANALVRRVSRSSRMPRSP